MHSVLTKGGVLIEGFHCICKLRAAAISRIQKRLSKKGTPAAPPPFCYCSAPFSLLSPDLLVSQNSLLGLVHTDIEYLKQQAKYVVK